jgi:hypothetical protein
MRRFWGDHTLIITLLLRCCLADCTPCWEDRERGHSLVIVCIYGTFTSVALIRSHGHDGA